MMLNSFSSQNLMAQVEWMQIFLANLNLSVIVFTVNSNLLVHGQWIISSCSTVSFKSVSLWQTLSRVPTMKSKNLEDFKQEILSIWENFRLTLKPTKDISLKSEAVFQVKLVFKSTLLLIIFSEKSIAITEVKLNPLAIWEICRLLTWEFKVWSDKKMLNLID